LKTFVTLFWKTGFPSAESLQVFARKGFEIKSTPTDVSKVSNCRKNKAQRFENVMA